MGPRGEAVKVDAICLPVGVGVRITGGIHATDFCRRFEAMQAVAVDARCAISHTSSIFYECLPWTTHGDSHTCASECWGPIQHTWESISVALNVDSMILW